MRARKVKSKDNFDSSSGALSDTINGELSKGVFQSILLTKSSNLPLSKETIQSFNGHNTNIHLGVSDLPPGTTKIKIRDIYESGCHINNLKCRSSGEYVDFAKIEHPQRVKIMETEQENLD